MRIMVIDPDPTERAATARILTNKKHEVLTVGDVQSGVGVLARQTIAVDVMMIELVANASSALDFVRRIRVDETHRHAYLIVTASTPVSGDIDSAFAAGADDFVRKAVLAEELPARLGGAARARARAWDRALRSDEWIATSGVDDPTSFAAWQELPAIASEAISEMVSLALKPTATAWRADHAMVMAHVHMRVPGAASVIVLRVAAGPHALRELGRVLLDDAGLDPAMTRDILREIANSVAGAFKREVTREGHVLTVGLPANAGPSTSHRTRTTRLTQWTATSESGWALHFEADVVPAATAPVLVSGFARAAPISAPTHSTEMRHASSIEPRTSPRLVLLNAAVRAEIFST